MNDPMPPQVATVNNGRESAARPRLSVLAPTFRHDPTPLIDALARELSVLSVDIELLICDDGSCDADLVARIANALQRCPAPARLLVSSQNQGRARARNALVDVAHGDHVLLLDADMRPRSPDFLARWLTLIATENPDVAFGGFTVADDNTEARTALHRYLARRADCHDAATRAADPARFTATSNLLVRRDILAAVPFDARFSGWGWEDVEWALRVSEVCAIRHIDNPALHDGLDTPETLIAKYRQAGANYNRLARAHPAAMARFPGWRAAHALSRTRAHAYARPLLAAIARADGAPMLLRHAALKLFRTSIYADNLP